jgi:polyphosphate kinase
MNNMTVETKNFPQGRFSERDLSWLSFNERVLDLAQDPNIPILERA